ncbi:MAG TPA: hypothetical protein VL547_06145 [Dinghuibacter sp.]|jgi:hypothetical protein|uniref:hypothetical protein n=1 Tax=Dinghuibacter sp. TaxID=2024697 RepID=UPI002C9A6FFD|nr:hypothetical protein [Dinghuibacter sp.]HTJ11582.1 hypothetical protein [Dinghuibacter sp.]
MRHTWKSVFFLAAVSILSALAYGRLFTEAPVVNHGTYDVSGWGYPGQPTALQEAKVTHKHGSATMFRYYKRYMERGGLTYCLPANPVCELPVAVPSDRPVFYPIHAVSCVQNQARYGIFRGPPCLG